MSMDSPDCLLGERYWTHANGGHVSGFSSDNVTFCLALFASPLLWDESVDTVSECSNGRITKGALVSQSLWSVSIIL